GVYAIVQDPVNGGYGYVDSCLAGCIVNVDCTIRVRYPPICKQYVRDISYTLLPLRSHPMSSRFSNQFVRLVEVGQKQIQDITKSCRASADTMCQVQPAFFRLYRRRPLSVFKLFNGMVCARIDNFFLQYDSFFHTIHYRPTNPSSASCVDETILWTCIQCIFSPYEFRMQDHITLLAF